MLTLRCPGCGRVLRRPCRRSSCRTWHDPLLTAERGGGANGRRAVRRLGGWSTGSAALSTCHLRTWLRAPLFGTHRACALNVRVCVCLSVCASVCGSLCVLVRLCDSESATRTILVRLAQSKPKHLDVALGLRVVLRIRPFHLRHPMHRHLLPAAGQVWQRVMLRSRGSCPAPPGTFCEAGIEGATRSALNATRSALNMSTWLSCRTAPPGRSAASRYGFRSRPSERMRSTAQHTQRASAPVVPAPPHATTLRRHRSAQVADDEAAAQAPRRAAASRSLRRAALRQWQGQSTWMVCCRPSRIVRLGALRGVG